MQYRNRKFLAFYSEMALLQSDTRGYSRIAFFGPYRTIHPSTCRSGGFLVKLLDKGLCKAFIIRLRSIIPELIVLDFFIHKGTIQFDPGVAVVFGA
jgi:hypothetical protein